MTIYIYIYIYIYTAYFVHVNQQFVVRQEVCTEDRYFDVGQREGPSVVSPHANVQGERLSTVRVYSGTVGCLQFEWGGLSGWVNCVRYDADGCTRVYKEFYFIPPVPNIEDTTCRQFVTGWVRRRYPPVSQFSGADVNLQCGLHFFAWSPNVWWYQQMSASLVR